MTRTTVLRMIAALAGAVVVLAACGDDDTTAASGGAEATIEATAPDVDEDASAEGGAADQAGAETSVTGASQNDASRDRGSGVVEVEMVDFAYVGLPEQVPAGTQLEVVNSSESELHELVAIRLPDEEQRSVEELLALPEAERAALAGLPTTVLLAAPGGPQVAAVGDGTLTEPGRYAIICGIPTGVDPQTYLDAAATSVGPPQVPGGPPHFVNGMWAELVVE